MLALLLRLIKGANDVEMECVHKLQLVLFLDPVCTFMSNENGSRMTRLDRLIIKCAGE